MASAYLQTDQRLLYVHLRLHAHIDSLNLTSCTCSCLLAKHSFEGNILFWYARFGGLKLIQLCKHASIVGCTTQPSFYSPSHTTSHCMAPPGLTSNHLLDYTLCCMQCKLLITSSSRNNTATIGLPSNQPAWAPTPRVSETNLCYVTLSNRPPVRLQIRTAPNSMPYDKGNNKCNCSNCWIMPRSSPDSLLMQVISICSNVW